MKKPTAKKALPPWVPIVVIGGVLVIIVALYMFLGKNRGTVPIATQIAELQKFVDQGGVPRVPREQLEKSGVKFPANYDELVAKRAAGAGGSVPQRPMQRGR